MTTRTLKFVYGTLTIGASQADANYTLTGIYEFDESYEAALLSFQVAINSATVAGFLASEATLITAYTKPDQKLEVDLGGTNRHTYDPSAIVNTGFNQRAELRKVTESPLNTDRSALYECSVTVQLPADLALRAGRLESSVRVEEDPSERRTATITGIYTALSSNAARAQFAASIEAYATDTVIVGLGGTWEQVSDPVAESDDQDKRLRFVRVYREIKRKQSNSATDLVSVVNPELLVFRSVVSTQSIGTTAEPPVRLRAQYSADVRFSSTTDLDTLWEDTLRQYALDEIEAATGTSILTIITEDWRLDPGNNRLEATLDVLGDGGSRFWQFQKEWVDRSNSGLILRPVWDGNPFSRDKYFGPATRTLTLVISSAGPDRARVGLARMPLVEHEQAPEVPGFEQPRTVRRVVERSVGIAGEEIPVYIATTMYFYVRSDSTFAGGPVSSEAQEAP